MDMGRRLLIAGAGADTPAATVACAIAFAMAARGMRVGVMKPVETGCAGAALEPVQARALALAASCKLPLDLICPCRYRASLPPLAAAAADGAEPPSFRAIAGALGRITAASDAVIVDAAGGIAVEIAPGADYADLAASAGLELVLVAANDRARLDDARLALRRATARSLRLAGVISADLAADTPPDDAAAVARMAGSGYLGRMRFREPLKLEIVARLL
jgi:dethiobiotin synthetase